MKDPALDVFLFLALAPEEPVDQAADFRADHFGHALVKQDVKAGIKQVETHSAERVRKRVGFGYQNLRAFYFFAADQHRRRAVTKQDRRDQVGLRNILALERERGKLDRDD